MYIVFVFKRKSILNKYLYVFKLRQSSSQCIYLFLHLEYIINRCCQNITVTRIGFTFWSLLLEPHYIYLSTHSNTWWQFRYAIHFYSRKKRLFMHLCRYYNYQYLVFVLLIRLLILLIFIFIFQAPYSSKSSIYTSLKKDGNRRIFEVSGCRSSILYCIILRAIRVMPQNNSGKSKYMHTRATASMLVCVQSNNVITN